MAVKVAYEPVVEFFGPCERWVARVNFGADQGACIRNVNACAAYSFSSY
jgi:hypothetical protein